MGEHIILSGITPYQPNPEKLIGTEVCIISNLDPRKLCGIMSEFMINLAEDADCKLVLIRPGALLTNEVEIK